MTADELMHILASLNPSTELYIYLDCEHSFPVCETKSDFEEVELETGQYARVFVLRPCICGREDDFPISIDVHTN